MAVRCSRERANISKTTNEFYNVWDSLPLTKCKLFFFPCTKICALPVGMWYGNNFTTLMCRQRVNWIKCNLLIGRRTKRNELLASGKCVSVCLVFQPWQNNCLPVKMTLPVVLIQLLKLLNTSAKPCKLKSKLICVPLALFSFPQEISTYRSSFTVPHMILEAWNHRISVDYVFCF